MKKRKKENVEEWKKRTKKERKTESTDGNKKNE